MDQDDVSSLAQTSRRIRLHIVDMVHRAGSGHPGGSLSAVEILTCLYFQVMRVRPEDPSWRERDRFVLSKGHAAPALYAVLAERGFFAVEELRTFSQSGTRLQKHLDMRLVPGAEVSTGSLGQGLSVAVGMALAARMDAAGYRVYALVGDGEMQEGQIWEAAMAAAHYKLDNLTVFVDANGLQVDGFVADVMNVEPIAGKWKMFNWDVDVIDGHDLKAILGAVARAERCPGLPHVVVARTVKGKGVSFMENRPEWHARALNDAEHARAVDDLNA